MITLIKRLIETYKSATSYYIIVLENDRWRSRKVTRWTYNRADECDQYGHLYNVEEWEMINEINARNRLLDSGEDELPLF